MKKLFKWLGILLLVLILIILVVLGVASFLLGTDKGFAFSAKQADKYVAGLELESVQGNVFRGVDAQSITFRNDALSVAARNLDSDWRLGCLLEKAFCLDKIIIDEVNVETFATDKPVEEKPPAGPIELPEINLPIDVVVKEILVRKLTFKAPGDAPEQVVNDIRLAVHTENGHQVFLDTLAARYQDYSANIDGDITLQGDYPLSIGLKLDARDVLPDSVPEGEGEQPVQLQLDLSNTLRDLAIDTQISGAAEASLTGTLQPLEETLPVKLKLASEALGWPITSRSQVLARDTAISVEGTLDDYDLVMSTSVSGEQVPDTTLLVEGRVNTQRATIPTIAIDTLGGRAEGKADVSWADNLNWSTGWDIQNIDPSIQLPDVQGQLSGKIDASGQVVDGNWTVDVQQARVSGELRDYPFNLDAKVSKGLDNVWNVTRVILNNGKNQIDAKGRVSDTWDLAALIKLPELQNLLPELQGGIKADVAIKGALQTPDVTLSANASSIQFNDILVDGFSLDAGIKELFVQQSDLKLRVGTVQVAEQTIKNARLDLKGSRGKHTLSLFADGPQATAIDLNLSGSLTETFDWAGILDAVTLEVPAHTINLSQPTALSWDNRQQQFAVDAHCWVTGDSNLCLENKVLAEPTGTATISLDQYSLARLEPFLPAETSVSGTLKLDTVVNWGDDQNGGFSANAEAQITDGGASAMDGNDNVVNFSYDLLSLNTRATPTQVEADISLASKNLGQADINVTLDPSGEEKPIKGKVSLDGLDIGIAQAFLPDFEEVSGTLSVNGDLSGQLTDPRFDGTVTLSEPVARAEILPLPLTGGEIVTTIKGKRAVIGGELKSDEGRITIDGAANWRQLSAWQAEITLTGEKLNVQSDPLQESRIFHDISILAQPGSIRVNGDIDIPLAVIDVAELPQGASSVSSDVVIIEDIEEEEAPIEPPGDTKLLVALNITLGEDVSLSAYGLNANLTGDMQVRLRSPNPPQLAGEISVVDGIYKQYGQNLQADGEILFVGPINQSRLAIDAIREIDGEDRIAGLRIQGTVATPEIELFTEPSDKPQDSILSYIVLGRDINETSDQEANLLATAALALTVKGGRNIAGGIADALGVEDFALETRGRGDDTELVVSGRVSDRLLLRYGRSVFEPQSTLYLRYDLTKKLYLEAAQGAERAVDLFYSFSF